METLAEEWLRLDKVIRQVHTYRDGLNAYTVKDPATRFEIEKLVEDNNCAELQKRLVNSK